MATNQDVLMAVGRLEAQVADARTDLKELSVYVMGNGAPENGLMHRVTRIEDGMTAVRAHVSDKKIHGFGWWKHRYIAAVGGLAVAAIVLWFALYALATANQELLLEIVKALT